MFVGMDRLKEGEEKEGSGRGGGGAGNKKGDTYQVMREQCTKWVVT